MRPLRKRNPTPASRLPRPKPPPAAAASRARASAVYVRQRHLPAGHGAALQLRQQPGCIKDAGRQRWVGPRCWALLGGWGCGGCVGVCACRGNGGDRNLADDGALRCWVCGVCVGGGGPCLLMRVVGGRPCWRWPATRPCRRTESRRDSRAHRSTSPSSPSCPHPSPSALCPLLPLPQAPTGLCPPASPPASALSGKLGGSRRRRRCRWRWRSAPPLLLAMAFGTAATSAAAAAGAAGSRALAPHLSRLAWLCVCAFLPPSAPQPNPTAPAAAALQRQPGRGRVGRARDQGV